MLSRHAILFSQSLFTNESHEEVVLLREQNIIRWLSIAVIQASGLGWQQAEMSLIVAVCLPLGIHHMFTKYDYG